MIVKPHAVLEDTIQGASGDIGMWINLYDFSTKEEVAVPVMRELMIRATLQVWATCSTMEPHDCERLNSFHYK